jgi:hypothetical protein
MAQPALNLGFLQDASDITIATVSDTTADYGQGGVEARGDAANFLLWSKTDQDGNRVFTNPDFGNVLSVMNWSVSTQVDGWYQGILVRVQPYNNGSNYVPQQASGDIVTQYASIVYYGSTNKVYQCIAPSTGNLPTNTAFWAEVTDLSVILDNTNIQVKIVDIQTNPRASRCVSSKFAKLDDQTCQNDNGKSRNNAYYLRALLVSANSEFLQGNPEEMEKIIRQLESKCSMA